jgi:hypothetical protein
MNYPQWLKDRLVFQKHKKLEASAQVLKQVLPQDPHPCGDCDEHTVTGHAQDLRYCYGNDWTKTHLKTHCKNCDRWLNPKTGKFDLERKEYANAYKEFYHIDKKNRKK